MSKSTELSNTVYDWLSLLGIKVHADYCTEQITSHTDYPAITAATDFLDEGYMSYQAVKADLNHVEEFNYPLLVHIKERGTEYLHILKDLKDWESQKNISNHWSGIAIFPQKNATWSSKENQLALEKDANQKAMFIMWCAIGLSLFAISIFIRSNFLYNIFGFLSLSGIFISIATFKTELGIQNKTIKQVCGIVSKGGCSKVLKSKFAKGIFGVTPSDISVIYFVAQYLLYISSVAYPNFFTILPYIAITGVILIGISIYTQYFVLKQWCALCLGIVVLLFFQAIISLFIVNTITVQSIIAFMSLSLLCLIILLPIKSLLKTVINSKPKIAEFKKWKQDANLFLTQLNTEQKVDTSIWDNDLVIGNPNAPILITVACNPYCSPCAKAHIYLDEMLSKHASYIKIQFRLLFVPNNENDKLTVAVTAILQQAFTFISSAQLQEALTDWYTWMNFEKWNNKWKVNSKINVEESLAKHSNWMKASNITHTPTFFINGKPLPPKYNLEDFEKILPQLVEAI